MLEVLDVARRFGDVQALDGVSFAVRRGRIVGFVGRNGSGKTTTMRVICGLVAPDRGSVLWDGRPVDAGFRSRIGYLPEERGLYPKMTAARQLAYLGELSGLDRAEAVQRAGLLVDRLGLTERAGDRVEKLSLGNQQRVQLAAALVHDPELLVLDEPFSGLDPVGVEVLAGVLRDEVTRGAAVLFSSHQLELVERLCDEVVIIDAGRVVRAGPVGEVDAPSQARRRLEIEVAGAGAAWTGALAGVRVVQADGDRIVVELDDGVDDQAVLDAARAAGPVRRFSFVEASLTDVFMEIAQR
jgi:ABC-2 type transport system ATP-binding protein